MSQRQTEYGLGLLQYHFSQQETSPHPVISPASMLPVNVAMQADVRYAGPDTHDLALRRTRPRARPIEPDLTIHHAIPTTPYPMRDQATPIMPYSMLDQEMPTMSYPVRDQATPIMPYSMLNQAIPIMSYPMLEREIPMLPALEEDQLVPTATKRIRVLRMAAIAVVLLSVLAFYFIWRPVSSASSLPVITQQNVSGTPPKASFSTSGTTTSATANSSGDIQVYILGAVKNPGVYTLAADARVYQLLQMAGGPLPKADLVALNLAAKLSDGQEVYVTLIGESPPSDLPSLFGAYASSSPSSSLTPTAIASGQLVNINTASETEMRQQLHISSKTAQTIITYRQQHGPFTSVAQLSGVVSKSIYDKIKNEVTV
jgi:competence protein ComEA